MAKKRTDGDTVLRAFRMNRVLMEAVELEASQRRVSVRAIVEQCVKDHFDPERAKAEQFLIIKELRGLRTDLRQVAFGNRVMVELSTLTTKNLFACLPAPTPASKSAGEGFYNALIAAVEKIFTADTPLLDKLAGTLIRADDPEFAAHDAATPAQDTTP